MPRAWLWVVMLAAWLLPYRAGHATNQIAYVSSVSTIQNNDYSQSQYVFVGVPDPASPPSGGNVGGTLFVKTPGAGLCTDNGVTVIVDKPAAPTPADCFIRTTKLNIRDFGARGDTRSGFADGYFQTGSATIFCSPTAGFSPADVSKQIYIQGAASPFTATTQPGNPNVGPHYQTFVTTIASLNGTNCVNLAAPAPFATLWGSEPGPKIIAPGTNYSVGDILLLSGGMVGSCTGSPYTSCAATIKVNLVTLSSYSFPSPSGTGSGSPLADGTACILTGTTGTSFPGQKLQLKVFIKSGSVDLSHMPSPATSIASGGLYTVTPSLTGESLSGCSFPAATQPSITPLFGIGQYTMLWNGLYTVLPSGASQSAAVVTCALVCSGAAFSPSTAAQMNVFSIGTDDTTALKAAITAQNTIASITPPVTLLNSRVCVYAPAGVYSVTPLNTAGTNSGAFTRNGCIEGDGHLQTIFHVRPNTGGDLFAWYNAQGNNSRPYNGSILLLNQDQAGPACRGFAIEGDRTSNVDQNALTFYGLNDYILCTDIEVDYLLGSALRCGDTLSSLPKDATFCRESHFRDLRFTRTGDGTGYPVIMFDSQNNSDGDNNLDLSDIDIYNPRGTGMLITDHAVGGNSSHNIAMARVRWEGSEASVAGITTDLLRIEGGNAGTAHVTCSVCRWENPYLGAAAIHLTANTSVMPAVTPSDIVLDGRIITSGGGFGRGVQIDGGNNLFFSFTTLTSPDYNLYIPTNAKIGNNVFINGYGAEANWTYSIDPGSVAALLGPLQRVAGVTGSSIQAVLPTAVRGCTAVRGPGAVDLQTDCSAATQGATGTDAALAGGTGNTAAGPQTFVGAGSANVASGTNAAIVAGQNNAASGANSSAGGSGANDIGRTGTNCWSSAPVAAGRLAQTCTATLIKTATGTSLVRLTADGGSPGTANVFNIPNSTAFALQVTLTAVDTGATATNYTAVWNKAYILARDAAGNTTLDGVSTTFPPDVDYPMGGGTATAVIQRDNFNGGLYVAFTPAVAPVGSRHVTARVESTEIQ